MVVATPERDSIHFKTQHGRTIDIQKPILPQLLARSHGEWVGTGKANHLPFDGRLGGGLHRHQQPLIGLRHTCRHDAIGGG